MRVKERAIKFMFLCTNFLPPHRKVKVKYMPLPPSIHAILFPRQCRFELFISFIFSEANSNHQCHSYSLEISWPDRISENQSGKTSEAGLDQKLKQDSSNSPCFKFYVSISNSSDGSTHRNGATQSILEFRSCMPDDFPRVKSGQVAVAVHKSFFNCK